LSKPSYTSYQLATLSLSACHSALPPCISLLLLFASLSLSRLSLLSALCLCLCLCLSPRAALQQLSSSQDFCQSHPLFSGDSLSPAIFSSTIPSTTHSTPKGGLLSLPYLKRCHLEGDNPSQAFDIQKRSHIPSIPTTSYYKARNTPQSIPKALWHVETPWTLNATWHNGATSSHVKMSQLSLTTLGSLPTKNMYTKNTYSTIDDCIKKESSTPLQTSNKCLKLLIVEGSIPQWKDKPKPVAITSSATKQSNSVDTGHTNWRSDSLKVPLPSSESITTQESHIWLEYNVIHERQKVQLVKAAYAHTKEMMEMMHSSPEDYTKLYLCALPSLAEEYAE